MHKLIVSKVALLFSYHFNFSLRAEIHLQEVVPIIMKHSVFNHKHTNRAWSWKVRTVSCFVQFSLHVRGTRQLAFLDFAISHSQGAKTRARCKEEMINIPLNIWSYLKFFFFNRLLRKRNELAAVCAFNFKCILAMKKNLNDVSERQFKWIFYTV